MNRTFELQLNGPARRWRAGSLLVALLALSLAGCGGGGGSSDEEPAPAPPPPAPPPPPPPPGPSLPPISSTVVSLDDGRTVGAVRWSNGNTSVGGQGQTVEGLECAATTPVGYHAHAHLSIFLNGEALAIPREVGIVTQSPTTGCHYPVHTHDLTGMIHLHATAPTTFTLGQFFSIWGQPLQSTDIAGLLGMPVVVYVTEQGVVSKVDDNWAAIELKSHREITIQVGTAITEIPNFTWTGD